MSVGETFNRYSAVLGPAIRDRRSTVEAGVAWAASFAAASAIDGRPSAGIAAVTGLTMIVPKLLLGIQNTLGV